MMFEVMRYNKLIIKRPIIQPVQAVWIPIEYEYINKNYTNLIYELICYDWNLNLQAARA